MGLDFSKVGKKSQALSAALRFLLAASIILFLDRLSKYLVMEKIPWTRGNPTYHFGGENEPISVIDNLLYIVHITNEGAAWGILSGRTYLLTSIAILALAGLWLFRKYFGFDSIVGQVSLGMFAGGVLGNLIDRISYGHVIDFIDVHIPLINYRWPAFNVADCGICIGVGLYVISVLIDDWKQKKSKKSAESKV